MVAAMTGMLLLGLVILAVPVTCWLAAIVVNRRKQAKPPPEPTPWADNTKVAAEVRRLRGDDA